MPKDLSDSRLFVVSWNTTKMCNLKCEHCYLDADYLDGTQKDELTTEEGYKLIDEIHSINDSTVLILTGGEPLLRDDIYKLGKYAGDKGLMPVLGTNGMLITDEVCEKLIANNIAGIGVSIDSLKPEVHDEFRGHKGALEATLKGLATAINHGFQFQVQTTVTKKNFDEISDIVEFSYKMGCKVFNLFFLVCTGRGQDVSDITPDQYEEMLSQLVGLEEKYRGKMIIKAKCAPHFKRVAYNKDPDSTVLQGYTSDCLAGVHYCRVNSDGSMTSCPYMPLSIGNIKVDGFANLWKNSQTFHSLRKKEFKGKCGECEFKIICGGCRARSYSSNDGDFMLDDPWCEYEPPKDGRPDIKAETDEIYWVDEKCDLTWADDANKRLEMIPKFVRNMVVKSVERFAAKNGYKVITAEVMTKSREGSGTNHKMPGMGSMPGISAMKSMMSKFTK